MFVPTIVTLYKIDMDIAMNLVIWLESHEPSYFLGEMPPKQTHLRPIHISCSRKTVLRTMKLDGKLFENLRQHFKYSIQFKIVHSSFAPSQTL